MQNQTTSIFGIALVAAAVVVMVVVAHLSYRVASFTDGFDDMKTRAEITTQIDLRDKKQSKWKTAAN